MEAISTGTLEPIHYENSCKLPLEGSNLVTWHLHPYTVSSGVPSSFHLNTADKLYVLQRKSAQLRHMRFTRKVLLNTSPQVPPIGHDVRICHRDNTCGPS
ncbi:hypothetical protein GDO81_017275 [Engystomops pustulosus]|uniref:Uncharacterized protein n=1 Tax=Engystomops pustulosus TaxID=76066 RepID=A0AAV7AKM1_ENGPU|nr:hypothetical protein GDO81_017275 [Engystomops pustulosus]